MLNIEQINFMKNNLFVNYLLCGKYDLFMQSLLLSNDINLEINIDCFYVSIFNIIKINKRTGLSEEKRIDKFIDESLRLKSFGLSNGYQVQMNVLKLDDSNQLILLISPINSPKISPIQFIKNIQALLNYHHDYLFSSISCQYSGYEKVSLAYKEARKLIDYSFFNVHENVISSEFISNYKIRPHLNTLYRKILKLKRYLFICDQSHLLLQCNELEEIIKHSLTRRTFDNCFYHLMSIINNIVVAYQLELPHKDFDFNTCDFMDDGFNYLKEILLFCIEHMTPLYPSHIIYALSYIRNHYDEDILLEDIAEFAGVNTTYLSSEFSSVMHISILKYIHKIRIEKSKSLLAETSLTVNEIAHTVGYLNVDIFRKYFKENIGVLPIQFRQGRL